MFDVSSLYDVVADIAEDMQKRRSHEIRMGRAVLE
jgi:hypothetical protein